MKWLAKPILWLMTSAIPVFIAACYGSPYDGNGPDNGDNEGKRFLKGKVVKPGGEGIPGIEVSCLTDAADAGIISSRVFTMADDGAFVLEAPPGGCVSLRAADVDGPENGSFESKEAPVTGDEDLIIELTPAE
jgi:hypothetical protein